MINYTESYFDLKLLKISDIKLHENTENKRLRNIFQRISHDKFLMNPVIVAKYDNDYILIDGANRLSSLQEIGCKLILAQIIDYKDKAIKLLSWNHFVYDFELSRLIELCEKEGYKYEYTDIRNGQKDASKGINKVLASDIENNKHILITFKNNFEQSLEALLKITSLYAHKYIFDRTESDIKIKELQKFSRKKGVLIDFPDFKKEDIVKIARNNLKIPTGISRHILKNRVLHVKYPIKNLLDENNLDKKSKELEKHLYKKIDDNKVRQYKESVIIFDE
ncbi:MAG TPA: ParB N-terminal domain-containing protein [Ignavibacteria bacterium]|nr:ParB N-terminal domain-containing protein [Ignavibacteria bacterium]